MFDGGGSVGVVTGFVRGAAGGEAGGEVGGAFVAPGASGPDGS